MNISFSITTSEADIIAAQYGFDGKTDKDEFVLEQFKQFGRDCITSKATQSSLIESENLKNVAVEAAKTTISF